jgi:hypothetical protein
MSDARLEIARALRSPGAQMLSNNALAERLHRSVVLVRAERKILEGAGVIPEIYDRISRRGGMVNVRRVLESPGRLKGAA